MVYCINGKLFNCVFDAIEYRDILDANYIIRRLWEYDLNVAQESYYDHIHFKCFVYRELNNVLFNRLCNV